MLSIKVEKEIQHENPVMGNLTLRQLACVSAAGIIGFVVWSITRIDIDQLLPVFVVLGIAAALFGWVKKDGMHAEDYIIRVLKRLVYHSGRLKYRTANKYVSLINAYTIKKNSHSMDNSNSHEVYDRRNAKAFLHPSVKNSKLNEKDAAVKKKKSEKADVKQIKSGMKAYM